MTNKDDNYAKLIEYFTRKEDLSQGISFAELLWVVVALKDYDNNIEKMIEEQGFEGFRKSKKFDAEEIMKHLPEHDLGHWTSGDLELLDKKLRFTIYADRTLEEHFNKTKNKGLTIDPN